MPASRSSTTTLIASGSGASIRSSCTGSRCRSSRRCRWRSDRFFGQPGMAEKNLTLDWYPVGTGPYMLTENNPNRVMVLERNPNFHGETYPSEGEPADAAAGLLKDAGKPLPFIDKVVFSARKGEHPVLEQVPAGLLRRLGHRVGYVRPGRADVEPGRGASSPSRWRGRASACPTSVAVSTFLHGVQHARPGGGRSLRAGAQAAAGDLDRRRLGGVRSRFSATAAESPAQGPIPPGIFGYRDGKEGINPVRVRLGREGAACASRSRRRRSCWPRPAIRTASTPGPARRWCSTST